jgi:hypothetical protein
LQLSALPGCLAGYPSWRQHRKHKDWIALLFVLSVGKEGLAGMDEEVQLHCREKLEKWFGEHEDPRSARFARNPSGPLLDFGVYRLRRKFTNRALGTHPDILFTATIGSSARLCHSGFLGILRRRCVEVERPRLSELGCGVVWWTSHSHRRIHGDGDAAVHTGVSIRDGMDPHHRTAGHLSGTMEALPARPRTTASFSMMVFHCQY